MRRGMTTIANALVLSTFGALAIIAIQACLPEQERTPYGPPETLAGRKLPEPENATPFDAGVGQTSNLCDGKGPIASGDCAKSWKTDIFPAMIQGAGTMKCTNAGCHSESAGVPPLISDTDAAKAWQQLAEHKYDNKAYINVCSKVPDESSLPCNFAGTCGTASRMPKAPGIYADATQLATLKTWLECGSPNN